MQNPLPDLATLVAMLQLLEVDQFGCESWSREMNWIAQNEFYIQLSRMADEGRMVSVNDVANFSEVILGLNDVLTGE